MEVDPYQPPSAPLGDAASVPPGVDLRRLVFSYRALVRWVGVQLLFVMAGSVAIVMAGPWLGIPRDVGVLVSIFPLAIYSYRTASALGSKVGVIWALAMVVPLVNLITLLILSSRATKTCRAAGIPVGFFGPKKLPEHSA